MYREEERAKLPSAIHHILLFIRNFCKMAHSYGMYCIANCRIKITNLQMITKILKSMCFVK